MVSSSPIRLQSLGGNKMQSTPLARLSPTSEMSHQTPRILTLQVMTMMTTTMMMIMMMIYRI